KEYDEAKARLKNELVSAAEVERWTKQAEDAKAAIQAGDRKRKGAQAELDDLQRIANARPLLQRRSDLLARLEPLRSLPHVRTDLASEWKPLPESLAGLRQLIESHAAEITRLEVALAGMPSSDAILSQAEAVERLHGRCEQRMQAQTDKVRAEQLVR